MQPFISVGILHSTIIKFTFHGSFIGTDGERLSGDHAISLSGPTLTLDGRLIEKLPSFTPENSGSFFELYDVVIGIGFHWQQTESQRFSGVLIFVEEYGSLWAVNRLPIEDYLFCVIASEMKATSSLELLKAHAVVSRSWLIAQIEGKKREKYRDAKTTTASLIKWYDRENHTLFDVCADDHCQRYQGLTRATNSVVRQAIDATKGMMLVYQGDVCDARFSKCCGGMTELFETCWQPVHVDYLQSFVDNPLRPSGTHDLNLTRESDARKWIEMSPDAYCNTQDEVVLRQILNDYDVETTPQMYRWKIQYSRRELSELIERKMQLGIGEVRHIEPVKRGPSARIEELRIEGTNRTVVIGKELEIRKALSDSHLQSSAFVVDEVGDTFVLKGAGWGHGVGMCQVGAAMMAHKGMTYRTILFHYFRRAQIEVRW
ncbi:MAG: SpoIID/LytB domain-containing protein [Marinilabiliaceae bacterium]|nr:SpoIID/LytB domain-containing protein [Marinilabiliaceae bacterium]